MGGNNSQCCTADLPAGIEVVKCHELDQKLGHPRCWRNRGSRSSTCGNLLCSKPLQFPRKRLVEFEETELLGGPELQELSPHERNARLQDLVRSFVLRASGGVRCQLVDAITGYSWPAKYAIDGRLQHIHVEVNGEMHWTCRISEVQHVRVWQDGLQEAENLFPAALTNSLSRDEMQCLVMVEQKDGGRLCLLEEAVSQAEELRVAISILGLYAREQGSAAQQPAAAAASRGSQQGDGQKNRSNADELIEKSIRSPVTDLLL